MAIIYYGLFFFISFILVLIVISAGTEHSIHQTLLVMITAIANGGYFALAMSRTLEEALRRAKAAGKRPGCWYGGIVLRSGKRGFAVYMDGKVLEQYSAMGQ